MPCAAAASRSATSFWSARQRVRHSTVTGPGAIGSQTGAWTGGVTVTWVVAAQAANRAAATNVAARHSDVTVGHSATASMAERASARGVNDRFKGMLNGDIQIRSESLHDS